MNELLTGFRPKGITVTSLITLSRISWINGICFFLLDSLKTLMTSMSINQIKRIVVKINATSCNNNEQNSYSKRVCPKLSILRITLFNWQGMPQERITCSSYLRTWVEKKGREREKEKKFWDEIWTDRIHKFLRDLSLQGEDKKVSSDFFHNVSVLYVQVIT